MTTAEVQLPEIDFALSDIPDLYDVLATLKTKGNVVRILFAGRPLWLISGYEQVKTALSNEEYLSCPEAYKRSIGRTMGTVIATMKGQQHRVNRAIVANVFFPAQMRTLVETVFSVEAKKLSEALKKEEQVDLMTRYTKAYTFNVITTLLGLPSSDADKLTRWADQIMKGWEMENAIKARDEMSTYLEPIIEKRRLEPDDSFISLLLSAEVDGEKLSNEEIFSFIRNLFPAGIDTSTKSLGSLLYVVLHDPKLRQQALESNDARERIVQELLRWQPPLAMVPRRCVKDIEIDGVLLKEGDSVMLSLAGANNDPEAFEDPRTFDPTREAKNLAFGHGEHFCLGTHMARRVLETGLKVILEDLPNMQLCEDKPSEIVHGVLRGPKDLWVNIGEN